MRAMFLDNMTLPLYLKLCCKLQQKFPPVTWSYKLQDIDKISAVQRCSKYFRVDLFLPPRTLKSVGKQGWIQKGFSRGALGEQPSVSL
jgi:hypothetical protein